MKKLESTFTNMVLSLVLIAVVAAAALAGVFTLTNDKIEDQKNQKRQSAIREVVLPDAAENVEILIASSDTITSEDGNQAWVIHNIHVNGEFIGAAVETSGTGFGGEQKLMVGFNPTGEIINYTVLEHQETPGLGDKITAWFKTEKGNQDIRGRKGGELLVKQDGGDVDAITAATISSRAFLKAIREAYVAFMQDEAEAITGASQLNHQEPEPEPEPEAEPEQVDATTEATTGATQLEKEASHE